MRIRHKLLALLLFFAVIPLLLSITISHTLFYRAGLHLAERTEQGFSDQAHTALQKLVDGFQQLQERDRRMIETALTPQTELSLTTATRLSRSTPAPPTGLFRGT